MFTAGIVLKRFEPSRRVMAALELACRIWRERAGNEIAAAVDVLRRIRGDCSATAKAVARRLRTYLVHIFLLSMPVQRSPEDYLAWLSTPCRAMDVEERGQHLLAFSKCVPNPKQKRVKNPRLRTGTSMAEERRVAFDNVSAAMDKVLPCLS